MALRYNLYCWVLIFSSIPFFCYFLCLVTLTAFLVFLFPSFSSSLQPATLPLSAPPSSAPLGSFPLEKVWLSCSVAARWNLGQWLLGLAARCTAELGPAFTSRCTPDLHHGFAWKKPRLGMFSSSIVVAKQPPKWSHRSVGILFLKLMTLFLL